LYFKNVLTSTSSDTSKIRISQHLCNADYSLSPSNPIKYQHIHRTPTATIKTKSSISKKTNYHLSQQYSKQSNLYSWRRNSSKKEKWRLQRNENKVCIFTNQSGQR